MQSLLLLAFLSAAPSIAAAAPSATSRARAPTDAATSPTPPALLEAIDHFNAGRYEATLRAIDRLGPAAAKLAQAQFYAGYACMRLERDTQALPRIEAALALTPDDLRAVYLRAVLRDRLNLPGARDDFARVRAGLPDTAIGRAAAEYLATVPDTPTASDAPDTSVTAGEAPALQTAADHAAPASGDAATSGTAATAAPTPTHGQKSPWRLRASAIVAYDSNPSYAANSYLQGGVNNSSNGTTQIASSVPAAPEGTVWVRGEYAPAPWGVFSLNVGLSALARAYVLSATLAADAVPLQQGREAGDDRALRAGPGFGGGGSGNGGATGGTGTGGGTTGGTTNEPATNPNAAPTTSTAAATTSSHQYDYDEIALDVTGVARPRDIDVRAGYRGAVSWLGYDLYAHAHTLWSSVSWPRRAKYRLGVRAQADIFRPTDTAYAFLQGEGGTLKALFTAYFFDDDLLLEVAYALDGYDAANFTGTAGQFYSYTFVDHGPDLLVSYLAPFDIHLSAWGTLRLKSYFGDDIDPVTSSAAVRRYDTLVLAGARLGQTWTHGFGGFLEFTYTRILSNVTFAAHDGNLQRMLGAVGVFWE